MFRTGPPPRHLAGRPRPQLAGGPEPADGEVTPVARVHRSRLAFAMSATVAALPILVLDNLQATAEPGGPEEVVAASDADRVAPADPVRIGPATSPAPAGEPTDAPASTDAAAEPSTTVATATGPSTPQAPATTGPEPAPGAAAPPPAPASEAAPSTTAAPAPPAYGDPADPATWERLAQCESGGRWHLDSGNGYYGGLQFSLSSWQEVGGVGYPHEVSREEQIHRGRLLQDRYGWSPWPNCSAELGYR